MSLVGRQIGRYRILEQLGSGGMSVVYKGLDTALEREVAVKVLHPHLAGKDESRRRLAREAKAVAKLHHPNILEVFDFSTLDAQDAYIVTEYIRGQTLRHFIESPQAGQRFDPPELAAMAVHELAAALAHAHEAGVIHRDLKPENVMVRDDGILKLMDFGIAKIVDRDEKMTMTGALVGSPAHMAPEIIEGEEAGPEADVFSLGTILFLLATGKLPFTAANTTATLKRILDGQFEDPRALNPAISDELAEILARCLARDPVARYGDGGQLRDALAEYLETLSLEHPDEELASYFVSPTEYRVRLTGRLVTTLVARAEALRVEKRPAKAMAALNHALALRPDHPGALKLLETLRLARRREQRRAQLRKAALAATAAGVLVAAVALVIRVLPEAPARTHLPATETASTLPPRTEPPPAPPPTSVAATTETRAAAERVLPAATTVAPSTATLRKPRLVPVTLRVRPFGYVQVDAEPRSADALMQHELKLPAGKHVVTVSCDLGCEEVSKEITVLPGGRNVEALAVRLKPSYVHFDYQPEDATVRIGDETRTVRETRERPFRVESPDGPKKLQHAVTYEISKPGFVPVRETAWIAAGQPTTLSGALTPE